MPQHGPKGDPHGRGKGPKKKKMPKKPKGPKKPKKK